MVIIMNDELCIEELLSGLSLGMLAIDHIIDKIKDQQLYDIVIHQRKDYGDLKERIMEKYPSSEDEVKQKFMLEAMLKMKTLLTNDRKIAKMLIEGCNQSIMTMTHLLNKQQTHDMHLLNYAHTFEDISKKYIDDLKSFL